MRSAFSTETSPPMLSGNSKFKLPIITAELAIADVAVATGLVSYLLTPQAGECAGWRIGEGVKIPALRDQHAMRALARST